MKYDWNLNQLNKLEKKHLFLLKTERLTKEEKEAIKAKIEMIKELKEIIEPKHFVFLENLKDILATKNAFREIIDSYTNIPKEIRKWILNAIHVFHNFEDTHNDVDIPKTKLSNKELIELSHDFFKWLPNKKYIHTFEKFTNPKNHLLRFQSYQQTNSTIGTTYPFYYPFYIPYFLIVKDKSNIDFATLNHEIAHGIYLAHEKYTSSFDFHTYFFGLEGYFFDFLSLEFLKEKKIVSEKIISKLEFNECITAIDEFISFYLTFLRLSLLSHHQKIKIESLYQKILEHNLANLIHENTLSYYFYDDPKSSATYTLSYLINLDLETIYKQDPQYAFYLFESIRKDKCQNIKKTLEQNQITFMHDHYQNLHAKLRKLNLIKK